MAEPARVSSHEALRGAVDQPGRGISSRSCPPGEAVRGRHPAIIRTNEPSLKRSLHLHREDRGMDGDVRTVVLVEGISDQLAVGALARRRGRNLDAEGISVVPIGGAQAIGRFLNRFGPQGLDLRLAGLCDAAEEADFRRALERAGLGSGLTRSEMERLGFYVCVVDLEDELIRALGTDVVEELVDAQGQLGSFRTLQKQPAWQGRPKTAAPPDPSVAGASDSARIAEGDGLEG